MIFSGRKANENDSKNEMEAVTFYESIETYYRRVDSILTLIRDYFDHRKTLYTKEYMAVKITQGDIIESTQPLNDDIKERIAYWLRHPKTELDDSIYTIEFFDKIFFCKIFEFGKENVVLAGYVLEETALVRTFISKFSEQKIQEKYERILAII